MIVSIVCCRYFLVEPVIRNRRVWAKFSISTNMLGSIVTCRIEENLGRTPEWETGGPYNFHKWKAGHNFWPTFPEQARTFRNGATTPNYQSLNPRCKDSKHHFRNPHSHLFPGVTMRTFRNSFPGKIPKYSGRQSVLLGFFYHAIAKFERLQ